MVFLSAKGSAEKGLKDSETGQERGRGLEGGLCDPEAAGLFGMMQGWRPTTLSLLLHVPGPLDRSPLPPAQLLHLAFQTPNLGLQLGPEARVPVSRLSRA